MADSIPHIDKLARGISLTRDLKSNRKRFKDGYSSNAPLGLASRAQRWRLSWDEIDNDDVSDIETYFKDLNQNGGTATWTPHGQSTELRFEPDGEFTATYGNFGVGSVTIEIVQVLT